MRGLLISSIICFCAFLGFAQSIERSVIGAAGNEQKNATLILSSTVGESAVQTSKKTTLIITQGFQQSYGSEEDTTGDGGGDGKDTTSIVEVSNNLTVSLYPNPTHSYVLFTFNKNANQVLDVFDAGGKLVYSKKFIVNENEEQSIAVQDWENGVYHFRFTNDKEEYSSYRVVKQ